MLHQRNGIGGVCGLYRILSAIIWRSHDGEIYRESKNRKVDEEEQTNLRINKKQLIRRPPEEVLYRELGNLHAFFYCIHQTMNKYQTSPC